MEEYVGCLVVQDTVGDIVFHQPHLIKKIELEFGEELKNVRIASTPAAAGDTVVKMSDNKTLIGGLPK